MERLSVQREINGESGEALSRLVAATRAFADANGLDERQAHRLCIIVEELASNAFGHGDAHRVVLGLEAMGGAVRIALHDSGVVFDPRTHESGGRPDPDSGGGSGLAMIKAWCEIIDYRVGPDGNALDLVLRLEQR